MPMRTAIEASNRGSLPAMAATTVVSVGLVSSLKLPGR
jgi:hypothetical protein